MALISCVMMTRSFKSQQMETLFKHAIQQRQQLEGGGHCELCFCHIMRSTNQQTPTSLVVLIVPG